MFNVRICDRFNYALMSICLLFSLNLYSKDTQNTPIYILNMKEIAEKGNSDVQYNLGLGDLFGGIVRIPSPNGL